MPGQTTLKVYLLQSKLPYVNLAFEDYILRNMARNERIMILWRNIPSVVIGHFQNPWLECDLKKLRKNNFFMVRRQSGGGAVYHDGGNLNISILSSKELYDQDKNNEVIFDMLAHFGEKGEVKERNSIFVGSTKLSGSAFKETKDHKLHHATMLVDTQLENLNLYLTPDKPRGVVSKALQSVGSTVKNLKDFNQGASVESVTEQLINSFFKVYQKSGEVITRSKEEIDGISELKAKIDELSSWEWLYGETPYFKVSFKVKGIAGGCKINFAAKKGLIEEVEVESDQLSGEETNSLISALNGTRLQKNDFEKVFDGLKQKHPQSGDVFDLIFEQWSKEYYLPSI